MLMQVPGRNAADKRHKLRFLLMMMHGVNVRVAAALRHKAKLEVAADERAADGGTEEVSKPEESLEQVIAELLKKLEVAVEKICNHRSNWSAFKVRPSG